jgi:hypothetical protein
MAGSGDDGKAKPKRAPKRTMFGIAPPAAPDPKPDSAASESEDASKRKSKRPAIGTIQGMQSVPPPPPSAEAAPPEGEAAKGKRAMPAGIFGTGKSMQSMPKAERVSVEALHSLPKDPILDFDASPLPSLPDLDGDGTATPAHLSSPSSIENAHLDASRIEVSLPPLEDVSMLGAATVPPGPSDDPVSLANDFDMVRADEVDVVSGPNDAWATVPPGPPLEERPLSLVPPLTMPPRSSERRISRPISAVPVAPDPEHEEARQVVLRSNPPPARPSGVLNLGNDMRDKFALDDFSGAIRAAELLLGRDPENAEAKAIVAASRERLTQSYLSRIGPLEGIPRMAVAEADVRWLGLDHRAGFLLSRVDGMATADEVIDMSGFDRFEALRILSDLVDRSTIVVETRQKRRR